VSEVSSARKRAATSAWRNVAWSSNVARRASSSVHDAIRFTVVKRAASADNRLKARRMDCAPGNLTLQATSGAQKNASASLIAKAPPQTSETLQVARGLRPQARTRELRAERLPWQNYLNDTNCRSASNLLIRLPGRITLVIPLSQPSL
jgi:hypothetical protein